MPRITGWIKVPFFAATCSLRSRTRKPAAAFSTSLSLSPLSSFSSLLSSLLLTTPPNSFFLFHPWPFDVDLGDFITMIAARNFVAPARQCLRTTRVSPRIASPFSQVTYRPLSSTTSPGRILVLTAHVAPHLLRCCR